MADRDRNQPDVIAERVELRPALSSTGDRPVFLQQPDPPEPDTPEPPASPPAQPEPEPPAPPAEPAEPPAPEPAPQPEAKPDPRTTRAREAEARAERLERLLAQSIEALTAARQPPPAPEPTPPAPPAPPPPDPRPTRAQFDDPESFDAALVEWASTTATRRALADHQAQLAAQAAAEKVAADKAAAERTQAEQGKVLWDAHQERRAKFIEAHADYEEVVERAPDLFLGSRPGTQALVQTITRLEDGPAIAYYLAQNRADEARITAMTDPLAVVVEVGRISARLAQPKPVEVSRTPKPITPVSGNAMAAGKDPNAMTPEEWARHTGRDKPQFRPFLSSSGRPH